MTALCNLLNWVARWTVYSQTISAYGWLGGLCIPRLFPLMGGSGDCVFPDYFRLWVARWTVYYQTISAQVPGYANTSATGEK